MQKLVIVMAGPSGVGKDSIREELTKQYPDKYEKFANSTTREKRQGEIDGVSYHFIDTQEFKKKLSTGEIYEHAFHYGNYYGMSRSAIEAVWAKGKIAVNNCQINGIRETKKLFGNNCLTVFIKASRKEVESRLIHRGESPETIKVRLSDYEEFISLEPEFDFSVENKDLQKAVDELNTFIVNYLSVN